MILCFSSQSRIYHVCAQNILINHDSSQKTSNWVAAAPQNHHQIEHGRMLIEKGKLLVLFDDAIFYFFAWKCNKARSFILHTLSNSKRRVWLCNYYCTLKKRRDLLCRNVRKFLSSVEIFFAFTYYFRLSLFNTFSKYQFLRTYYQHAAKRTLR